jgi:DNA sulfur modification protein DndE
MKPPVETVRLTGVAREQLIQIKRATGEVNWNVCCRWALCYAFTVPEAAAVDYSKNNTKTGDVVEIQWNTFVGDDASIYLSLLQVDFNNRGQELAAITFSEYFYRLMYYGISALSRKVRQDSLFLLPVLCSRS